jgi:hypothetical protein
MVDPMKLVGGEPYHLEKYEFVSWEYDSQYIYMGKNV